MNVKKSRRINVVLDVYIAESIKKAERQNRAKMPEMVFTHITSGYIAQQLESVPLQLQQQNQPVQLPRQRIEEA